MNSLGKVGISLIGPPGTGKSTISKLLLERLPGGWHLHDQDTDGLESDYGLGKGGIAEMIPRDGDRAFLAFEETFTLEHYGYAHEEKTFAYEKMLFATSGSIVYSQRAIRAIQERTHIILIDTPMRDVMERIESREDGDSRIIGMQMPLREDISHREALSRELDRRQTLYKKYASHILEPRKYETPSDTATRLYGLIEGII